MREEDVLRLGKTSLRHFREVKNLEVGRFSQVVSSSVEHMVGELFRSQDVESVTLALPL